MTTTLTDQPACTPAPARWFIAGRVRLIVTGDDTGGAFDMVEMVAPAGDMPPLHVHHEGDETFHLLAGELTLHLPGGAVRLRPGDTFVAPRGVPHTYRVDGDGPARWLVIGSPAGFEAFVRESSVPASTSGLPPADLPVDPAALAAVAARHGIEILAPPGTFPTP